MESKMKHNTVDLTYEMICKALDGDESAEEQIFNHYEPYIITLSKIPYYDIDGTLKYRIDEDIYMSLKLKLHEVVRSFKIA